MYTIEEDCDYSNNKEVEDILSLVEKNVDCTNKLIKHIDAIIERKYFQEPILKVLTTIRNTCAVNVMNIARLTK